MVVFPDFDLDIAVDYALFAIYCNAGQVCSAGSRMIVEQSVYDQFVKKMAARAKKIRVGPGLEAETEMGPLVSESQLKRVLEYIEIGKKEGAKLVTGGDQPKGDKYGNLLYRKTARNFNPMMATAGKFCVAEVEELVDELDADNIHKPGIYVDKMFVGTFEKRIEQRTGKSLPL